MKVAAFQAPLVTSGSTEALSLIRRRLEQCEASGISLLCCPEAILGGLADYLDDPRQYAIPTADIRTVLEPLVSDTVTCIVGLSELADDGRLYNAAAVLHRGDVVGVYRKHHPAIRRSVYHGGTDVSVFNIGGLTFGILICYDSTFPALAADLALRGATVIVVPTNNGLPRTQDAEEIVTLARACDVARAIENGVWIVRADVAGAAGELVSLGSTAIVAPNGSVQAEARQGSEDLLVIELPIG
jgi:5-aminopentanamidase